MFRSFLLFKKRFGTNKAEFDVNDVKQLYRFLFTYLILLLATLKARAKYKIKRRLKGRNACSFASVSIRFEILCMFLNVL